MAALCVSPIKGTVMRLVKLDTCGNPVTGAESAEVVTDGFVSISPSPQYEDGETQQVRKANGAFCVNQIDPPELSTVQLTINWCVLDPDAIVLITGERLLTTNSVTGSGVAFGEGLITARFSLEVWQEVAGRGACTADGTLRYVYWAFMNVGNTKVNDFNFDNAPLQLATQSDTDATSLLWGTTPGSAGPWIDDPVEDGDHFLYNVTTTPPPTATCGAVLLS